jgi:hypothetical protein
MRTAAVTALCIGITLGVSSVGAVSDAGPSNHAEGYASVNRAHKGDRLALPHGKAFSTRTLFELPEGCDALVSPLASRQLARTAGRCES